MKYLLSLGLLILASLAQAELTVQLNAASVTLGQSVRLILTDDDTTATAPDLTPLKKDFAIIGTGRVTNYSIINNETHSSTQWTVELLPKHAGTLTIPAIRVGQDQTQATSVVVTSAGSNNNTDTQDDDGQTQQDVMMRAEISKNRAYVNEQVIYTVRLYSSKRLLDASYQPPTIDDGLLIPLGEARHYQVAEQGRYYSVEEQQYAVFPQKSGALTIRPAGFTALVYDDLPQQINVQAPTRTLDVKAVPAGRFTAANWLPAKNLILKDSYDQPTHTITQGSTLIRSINLEATGLPAQLVPPLTIAPTDQFRVYQDKAVEHNMLRQGDVVGNTTIKVTYLLDKAGSITIPAVQIPWFNTDTGETRLATLPELVITVTPNTTSTAMTPAIADKTATTVVDTKTPVAAVVAAGSWLVWLAIGFAAAWLLTLVLWWRQRSGSKHLRPQATGLQQLKQACAANQADQARHAVLQWAREQWPHANVLNLSDVSRLTQDDRLARQLDELSETLYQTTPRPWNGQALWEAVSGYKAQTTARTRADDIPPLHPSATDRDR